MRPAQKDVSARQDSPSSILDEAYLEYWRLEQEGQTVDPDAFCARYPTIHSALARRLHAHFWLEERPHLLKTDPQWPQVGEAFLGFRLERLLGQGTFAHVFLARQRELGDRLVALKVTTRTGGEEHTLGRLAHPNIVPVHSVERDPTTGLTALCMPFLGEETLLDVLDHLSVVPLSGPQRVLLPGSHEQGVRHLAVQLLDALAYLHGQGVFHCDLKPSNVLLTPAGMPMLLDFNLSTDGQRDHAKRGGTLTYMAPEQLSALGEGNVVPPADGRTDLFALGVILYELLTGSHPFGPFSVKTAPKEMWRQLLMRQEAGSRPVRALNRRVDRAFAAFVDRCLSWNPAARPQTASAAAVALRPPAGFVSRAWALATHRPRTFAALIVMSAIIAVTALALAFSGGSHATEFERGWEAYRQGQYEQAVAHFDHALAENPDDACGWFARGLTYQKLGLSDRRSFAQAASDFEVADRLDPQAKTKACLGYCLHARRQSQEAALLYEQALQSGYATAELLNNLGAAELAVAKPAQAEQHLGHALSLAPLQAAYHNRALAYLQLARQNPRTASSRKAAPSDAAARREDLLRKGIADAEKALAVGTPSGELFYDAAQICSVAARADRQWIDRALRYLDQALRHGVEPKKLADSAWSALRRQPLFLELRDRPHSPHPALKAARILPPAEE
jgi:tetratricopeptide (TPR) repeat protein